jgi:hypothetical protein
MVLWETQATALKSVVFPPILSRHGRINPPSLKISLLPFHPLDREKNLNLPGPAFGAVGIGPLLIWLFLMLGLEKSTPLWQNRFNGINGEKRDDG